MALNIGIQAVATSETLLRQAAGAIDNIDKLESAIKILGPGANALLVVGAVMSMVKMFIPDKKHEAIMKEFSELNEKIKLVRNDIKDLEVTMRWEFAELSYIDDVSKIENAMYHVSKHAKAHNGYQAAYYRKKIKDINSVELSRALDDLLDGVIGSGGFGSKPILPRFYDETGGDRNKLQKLSGELLQLLTGGLSALMAVEVIDEEGNIYAVETVANALKYKLNRKVIKAASTMMIYLDLCVSQAKSNMQKDLERIVEEKHKQRNIQIAAALCESLKKKYNWFLFHCLVYNNIVGFNNHRFAGSHVSKLHYFGKNAIAFYTGQKWFWGPEHIHIVNNLISEAQEKVACSTEYGWWGTRVRVCPDPNANKAFNVLRTGIVRRQIRVWGVAVIKRHVDLQYVSTAAGDRIIWKEGSRFTFLVLLDSYLALTDIQVSGPF